MADEQLIQALNEILEQEHACAIRYATHAALVTGPDAEPIAARLREIAQDERDHAEKLRARIAGLGGIPSMQVSTDDLKYADTIEGMLQINIEEELQAIRKYIEIFHTVSPDNAILYHTLQTLIEDEQEHLEELEALRK